MGKNTKRNLIMNILPFFAWLLDSFGILLIPIPLAVTAFIGIRNIGKANSRKELNICNVVLLISCVCGEALSTYYYYHNVSSDYMTKAVGVLAVIIAAAEVLILAVINNICFKPKETDSES